MKPKLADFIETIDHQIPNCSLVVHAQGYRLDGKDGIKTKLKILDVGGNAPKSVDYIQEFGADRLLFIEFSDLASQHQMLALRTDTVHSCLAGEYKKSILSEIAPPNILKQEISGKIRDTDFILRRISDEDLVEDFVDMTKTNSVLLVWYDSGDIDTTRLLDNILMGIKSSLSRDNLRYLNHKAVYFLTLEQYLVRYDCAN